MKQSIRYFSLGLFISALLLFGYNFFMEGSLGTNSSQSVQEMVASVEEEGYHVLSEKEYVSFTLQKEKLEESAEKKPEDTKKEDDKDTKNDNDETSTNKEEPEEEVKKVSLKTGDGIFTPQIADVLIENDIIDDRDKFIEYMDDNDYSSYIQLGTFEITSEMNTKEIAETLTTYPGN